MEQMDKGVDFPMDFRLGFFGGMDESFGSSEAAAPTQKAASGRQKLMKRPASRARDEAVESKSMAIINQVLVCALLAVMVMAVVVHTCE